MRHVSLGEWRRVGVVVGAAWIVVSAGCGRGCSQSPSPASSGTDPEPHATDEIQERAFPPADGSAPVVELAGASLELNPRDRTLSETLWRTGSWEPEQTKQLLQRLQPGDTFIDIGANLGYYTVLAATRVGPTGRVIAFEPDPESFTLLQRNVQRNALTQVVLENKAVGAESGTLKLFLSTANRGDHRIYDPGGGRTSVEVDIVALDAYMAQAGGAVRFIKIDTRGAECAILAGMQTTLTTQRAMGLAVAYTPSFVEAMGYEPRRCFGALEALGFSLQWIDEARGTVARTTAAALPPADDGALLLPAR